MTKEFKLSDFIFFDDVLYIEPKNVKEFLIRLKMRFETGVGYSGSRIHEIINELAGDTLI